MGRRPDQKCLRFFNLEVKKMMVEEKEKKAIWSNDEADFW